MQGMQSQDLADITHFSHHYQATYFLNSRPRVLPRNAQPLLDESSGICIGYSVAQAPGLWQILRCTGSFC